METIAAVRRDDGYVVTTVQAREMAVSQSPPGRSHSHTLSFVCPPELLGPIEGSLRDPMPRYEWYHQVLGGACFAVLELLDPAVERVLLVAGQTDHAAIEPISRGKIRVQFHTKAGRTGTTVQLTESLV